MTPRLCDDPDDPPSSLTRAHSARGPFGEATEPDPSARSIPGFEVAANRPAAVGRRPRRVGGDDFTSPGRRSNDRLASVTFRRSVAERYFSIEPPHAIPSRSGRSPFRVDHQTILGGWETSPMAKESETIPFRAMTVQDVELIRR